MKTVSIKVLDGRNKRTIGTLVSAGMPLVSAEVAVFLTMMGESDPRDITLGVQRQYNLVYIALSWLRSRKMAKVRRCPDSRYWCHDIVQSVEEMIETMQLDE